MVSYGVVDGSPQPRRMDRLCPVCHLNQGSQSRRGMCQPCWMLVSPDSAFSCPEARVNKCQLAVQGALYERMRCERAGMDNGGASRIDAMLGKTGKAELEAKIAAWKEVNEMSKRVRPLKRRASVVSIVSTARKDQNAAAAAATAPPEWSCPQCTMINAADLDACGMCGGARPSQDAADAKPSWACEACTYHESDMTAQRCQMCHTWRAWRCRQCGLENQCPTVLCSACDEEWDPSSAGGRAAPPAAGADVPDSLLAGLSAAQKASLRQEMDMERRRNESIEEARRRLDQRLMALDCTEQIMADDGNCLFTSLSFQLFRTQRFHPHIRAVVVSHMRRHSDSYSFYFEDDEEFAAYLDRMGRTTTWGDEITLRAASDALHVNICIAQSEAGRWILLYEPQLRAGEAPYSVAPAGTVPCAFLSYQAPVHYNSILPEADGEAKRLFISDLIDSMLVEQRAQCDEWFRASDQPGHEHTSGPLPLTGESPLTKTVLEAMDEIDLLIDQLHPLDAARARSFRQEVDALLDPQAAHPTRSESIQRHRHALGMDEASSDEAAGSPQPPTPREAPTPSASPSPPRSAPQRAASATPGPTRRGATFSPPAVPSARHSTSPVRSPLSLSLGARQSSRSGSSPPPPDGSTVASRLKRVASTADMSPQAPLPRMLSAEEAAEVVERLSRPRNPRSASAPARAAPDKKPRQQAPLPVNTRLTCPIQNFRNEKPPPTMHPLDAPPAYDGPPAREPRTVRPATTSNPAAAAPPPRKQPRARHIVVRSATCSPERPRGGAAKLLHADVPPGVAVKARAVADVLRQLLAQRQGRSQRAAQQRRGSQVAFPAPTAPARNGKFGYFREPAKAVGFTAEAGAARLPRGRSMSSGAQPVPQKPSRKMSVGRAWHAPPPSCAMSASGFSEATTRTSGVRDLARPTPMAAGGGEERSPKHRPCGSPRYRPSGSPKLRPSSPKHRPPTGSPLLSPREAPSAGPTEVVAHYGGAVETAPITTLRGDIDAHRPWCAVPRHAQTQTLKPPSRRGTLSQSYAGPKGAAGKRARGREAAGLAQKLPSSTAVWKGSHHASFSTPATAGSSLGRRRWGSLHVPGSPTPKDNAVKKQLFPGTSPPGSAGHRSPPAAHRTGAPRGARRPKSADPAPAPARGRKARAGGGKRASQTFATYQFPMVTSVTFAKPQQPIA
eukprot:TRINITY_DN16995_c0_g1_i1.p1 TRINITY_DN16995_c0_g1~~TRINITY_DN16995_c0_g1_i1.p1  ORF type:complete len:1183 (+),score=315.08 TRINITY_DN16995_c0_g1_i1:137-3685(+)